MCDTEQPDKAARTLQNLVLELSESLEPLDQVGAALGVSELRIIPVHRPDVCIGEINGSAHVLVQSAIRIEPDDQQAGRLVSVLEHLLERRILGQREFDPSAIGEEYVRVVELMDGQLEFMLSGKRHVPRIGRNVLEDRFIQVGDPQRAERLSDEHGEHAASSARSLKRSQGVQVTGHKCGQNRLPLAPGSLGNCGKTNRLSLLTALGHDIVRRGGMAYELFFSISG